MTCDEAGGRASAIVAGATPSMQGAGALNLARAYSKRVRNVYVSWAYATNWDQFGTQQTGGTWADRVWQSPTYSAISGGEGGTLWNGAVRANKMWD